MPKPEPDELEDDADTQDDEQREDDGQEPPAPGTESGEPPDEGAGP